MRCPYLHIMNRIPAKFNYFICMYILNWGNTPSSKKKINFTKKKIIRKNINKNIEIQTFQKYIKIILKPNNSISLSKSVDINISNLKIHLHLHCSAQKIFKPTTPYSPYSLPTLYLTIILKILKI